MLDSFKNPPAEYRVAPFWFWNAELDADEIERQVREMYDKGAGGFFIHGRFGLRTEYMGEGWMRCIERACDVASELGMNVYLYDENPFPSGVAGGEAMKDEKHFNKFLDITRQAVSSGETVQVDLPEGELLSVVAVDQDNPEHVLDIISSVNDCKINWIAPEGRYEVIAFTSAIARYPGFIYGSEPDYFEASLLDTFFDFTHNRYAARLKRYFGSVIKGIFTDEPKIQCIHHMHDDPFTTAWFADILDQFQKDHGYDLQSNLVCLATNAGPQTGKVRRDFWTTVTNQYVERFFKRYRKWCEDNGIMLTGHLFLEEGLYANTMYQGNFPEVLATFQIPGVDHLATVAEDEYRISTIPPSITRTHGQKIGSSTAHANGQTRVLSETFGCCGWALSMEYMKWIFDWQASMGVNLLCPHAFYYSLAGVRKTDAPPSQFYQATYWQYYRKFGDYVGRLCYALSQGSHRAQIALLYPIKGFHSEWAPGIQGPLDKLIADYFDIYCAYLMKEHVDYDILGEESINKACSVDQCLKLAGEEYELLVMPPTTAIGFETALKIKEFVEDGGKVIATMLLPIEDADGDKHEEVRQIFADLFGKDPAELRKRLINGNAGIAPVFSSHTENTFFFEANDPTDLIPVLRDSISSAIKPEVSIKHRGTECHDITYVHRTLDGGDIYFFTNNCGEAREVQISIRCDGAPYTMDLETGEATALANCTQQGSRTILLYRFERFGSLMVQFTDEPALCVGQPSHEEEQVIALSDEWQFETAQMNSLTLHDWKLNIVTRHDHMKYEYLAEFSAEAVPDDLLLVLDDMPEVASYAGCAGSDCSVFINGHEVTEKRPWTVDVNFQSLYIAPLVNVGKNKVKIEIKHGGWSGDPQLMIAEARVMGTFSLHSTDPIILPPKTRLNNGSWTDQGYPFYSGTGIYRQRVDIPDFLRSQRVVLRTERPADMVEFVVNGAVAGIRPWAPYEIDITNLVKPGMNTVELRVTNSLANLLLSEKKASGLINGASLVIY